MKKIYKIFFGILFLAIFYGMLAMRNYYTFHMPQTPQIELGRIIRIEVDPGKIVYVTLAEKRYLFYTYVAAGIDFLIFFAVVFFNKKSDEEKERALWKKRGL
jgi:hypothetical protein